MRARHDRRDAAPVRWRGNSEDAEEWPERKLQSPRQRCNIRYEIERNVHQPHVRKIIRQSATERTDGVIAPVLAQLNFQNSHFERVARPCALDRNRPGQYVRPHWLARHLRMDFQQLGRNMKTS